MANGDPIVIRQLDYPFTTLTLKGTKRPFKGVRIGTENNIVRTDNPGATQTSLQIMNSTEKDIPFRGMLVDRLTGVTNDALETMRQLRKLSQDRVYCEISWGSTFTKSGFIKDADFDVFMEGEISYEFTFVVVQAEEFPFLTYPTPKVTIATTISLLDLLADLAEAARQAALLLNLIRAVL